MSYSVFLPAIRQAAVSSKPPYRDFLAIAGEGDGIRPVGGGGAQALADGIAENVVVFLGEVRVVAKARVEEIALEAEAISCREQMLEIGDYPR